MQGAARNESSLSFTHLEREDGPHAGGVAVLLDDGTCHLRRTPAKGHNEPQLIPTFPRTHAAAASRCSWAPFLRGAFVLPGEQGAQGGASQVWGRGAEAQAVSEELVAPLSGLLPPRPHGACVVARGAHTCHGRQAQRCRENIMRAIKGALSGKTGSGKSSLPTRANGCDGDSCTPRSEAATAILAVTYSHVVVVQGVSKFLPEFGRHALDTQAQEAQLRQHLPRPPGNKMSGNSGTGLM